MVVVFTTFARNSFGRVNFREPGEAGLFDGDEGGDECKASQNRRCGTG